MQPPVGGRQSWPGQRHPTPRDRPGPQCGRERGLGRGSQGAGQAAGEEGEEGPGTTSGNSSRSSWEGTTSAPTAVALSRETPVPGPLRSVRSNPRWVIQISRKFSEEHQCHVEGPLHLTQDHCSPTPTSRLPTVRDCAGQRLHL